MHIRFITTGGTIDKIYFDELSQFEVGETQMEHILREGLVQIEYEAQQQVIQAEAAKNATIAIAEGEAEAQIIEAQATAAAIEVITSQMTPEYAQFLWLSQWDGKLPLVVGEGTGLIIDVNSLLEEPELPGG